MTATCAGSWTAAAPTLWKMLVPEDYLSTDRSTICWLNTCVKSLSENFTVTIELRLRGVTARDATTRPSRAHCVTPCLRCLGCRVDRFAGTWLILTYGP